jgi:hypothetical protein
MSKTIRLALLIATAAIALTASASAQAATRLIGTVGPSFTITLKTATGKAVKTLKPGRYDIAVTDRSSIHNFHLRGPGVNKTTSVAGTGKTTFKVTLMRGTYRFICDPHSLSLKGSFTVR